jgi:putative tryptophan/tyrosine transport system substrate-binding protein
MIAAAQESVCGHRTDMPTLLSDVRCWVNSGTHLLAASISPFDPQATFAEFQFDFFHTARPTGYDAARWVEGEPMRRREFIIFVGSAPLGWTVAARAQHAGSMPVIGLLTVANLPDWSMNAIRTGLDEAGFVEGRNLSILVRSAEGQFDRLPALAADLVKSQVKVILATGSPVPARTAKAATAKIPIVFAYGGDPIADGLVDSLNQPGGNVTGATFIGSALLAKRMEVLREIVPQATDIALLVNPKGTLAERQIRDGTAAAQTLGRRLHVLNTSTESDIDAAFATMSQLKVDAFIVSTDSFFGFVGRDRLVMQARGYKIPGIYNGRDDVGAGGLVSYGPNLSDTWRQAGLYVGRILQGEKPSDLPVMQPIRFEMIINLKTAKELGLTIPPMLLGLADKVIE